MSACIVVICGDIELVPIAMGNVLSILMMYDWAEIGAVIVGASKTYGSPSGSQ